MSNQKWEIGPVKLANGTDGYIDFVCDRGKVIRYTGRFKTDTGEWWALHWDQFGRVPNSCEGYGHNLAPPPKKTLRVRLWLNVYDGAISHLHGTREQADKEAGRLRFACIEIDREVEEGEGLEPNVRSDAANMRRAKQ